MSIKLKGKSFNFKSIAIILVVFFVVLGGIFFYIQHPDFFKNSRIDLQSQKIAALENKVLKLEQMLENYHRQIPVISKEDILALNEKVDDLGKINVEILNSKASLASQMGLVERMDELELKVNKLGQTSSQGALILTAANLVKEAAATGEPFMYEAIVLKELSANTPMAKSAEIIFSYAEKGLPSKEELISNFKQIYEQTFISKEDKIQKQKEIKDWKDKIIEKLKNLITIKKHDDSEAQKDEIWQLASKGDLKTASFKMEHNPKYQTEVFEIWRQKVAAEKTFNQALNKIQALTLGFLKTESLKRDNM